MSKLPISPSLDDLLGKFYKVMERYTARQAQKLSRLPQAAFQTLLGQFAHLNQQIETSYDKIVDLCSAALKGPHVKIEVKRSELQFSRNRLVKGKIHFTPPNSSPMQVDCFLAYGNWAKLGELKEDKINIIEHLDKLLPKYERWGPKGPIGLVTIQNGIMNDLKAFEDMCQLVIDQFPEGPLCIGLHNATTRILPRTCRDFYQSPHQIRVRSIASVKP